jgi:Family of unknown function (DUF6491)
MKKVIIFSAILACAALSAFTSQVSARPEETAGTSAPKAKSKSDDTCFNANSIKRFYTEDDDSMMVTDYRGRSFRLELRGACFGIDTAMQLAIRTKGTRLVCGPFDAEVVYRDDSSGGRLRTCTIASITPMTKEEADAYDSSDTKKPAT